MAKCTRLNQSISDEAFNVQKSAVEHFFLAQIKELLPQQILYAIKYTTWDICQSLWFISPMCLSLVNCSRVVRMSFPKSLILSRSSFMEKLRSIR